MSQKIKPQRIEENMIILEVEKQEKKRLLNLKELSSFGKKSLILVSLFSALILVGTIYDAIFTASSMLDNAPFVGFLYIVLLLSFVGLLGSVGYKQFVGYKKLKRINSLQLEGLDYLNNQSIGVKEYAKRVSEHYKEHSDISVANGAKSFQNELQTLMDDEVLDRMDATLLKPLDKKAKEIILNYSTQTALSTAISPVAFIDAILIISRSHAMIKEVSTLYGYKPNFVGELMLVRAVFINLAFASITELLTHHSGDIFGSTMVSKISMHSAQGIANGVLTARVGLGTIRSVRPFVYKEKNEGFLNNITKTIIEKVFSSK
jgi:putative membrane protein